MKLRFPFEVMEMDDQIIAVPVGESTNEFHGVVKLNDTSAFILNLLKEDITEEDIVNALQEEYDAPRSVIVSDAKKCIAAFMEKGLLG